MSGKKSPSSARKSASRPPSVSTLAVGTHEVAAAAAAAAAQSSFAEAASPRSGSASAKRRPPLSPRPSSAVKAKEKEGKGTKAAATTTSSPKQDGTKRKSVRPASAAASTSASSSSVAAASSTSASDSTATTPPIATIQPAAAIQSALPTEITLSDFASPTSSQPNSSRMLQPAALGLSLNTTLTSTASTPPILSPLLYPASLKPPNSARMSATTVQNLDAYTAHMHATIKDLQAKNLALVEANADKQEALLHAHEKAKENEEEHKKHIRLYHALFSNLMCNFFVKSWKTKQMLFTLQDQMFQLIPPIIREFELNPSKSTTFDSNTEQGTSLGGGSRSRSTYKGSGSGEEGQGFGKKNPLAASHQQEVLSGFGGKSRRQQVVEQFEADERERVLKEKKKKEEDAEKELNALYAATAMGLPPSHAAEEQKESTSNLAVKITPSSSSATPRDQHHHAAASDSSTPAHSADGSSSSASDPHLSLPSSAATPTAAGAPPSARKSRHKHDKDSRGAAQGGDDYSAPHLQLDVTIDDVTRIARFRKVKRGARMMNTPLIDLSSYLETCFSILQQSVINLLGRLPQARVEAENLAQRNIELTQRLLELEKSKKEDREAYRALAAEMEQTKTLHQRLQNSYEVLRGDYDLAVKHLSSNSSSLRKGRETNFNNVAGMYVRKPEPLKTVFASPSRGARGARSSRSPSPAVQEDSKGKSNSQKSNGSGAGSAARAVEHLRQMNAAAGEGEEEGGENAAAEHDQQQQEHQDSAPAGEAAAAARSFDADDGTETDFLFDLRDRDLPSAINPPRSSPAKVQQPPLTLLQKVSLSEFKEEYEEEERALYAPMVAMKQEQDLTRNFAALLAQRADYTAEELRNVKQGRQIQLQQEDAQADTRTGRSRATTKRESNGGYASPSPDRSSSKPLQLRPSSATFLHPSASSRDAEEDPSDASEKAVRGTSSLSRPRPHSAAYGNEILHAGALSSTANNRQLSPNRAARGSSASSALNRNRSISPSVSSASLAAANAAPAFVAQPLGVFTQEPRFASGSSAHQHSSKASLRELSPGRPTSSFTSNKKFDSGDIGGTNLYLGATSASFDRQSFSSEIQAKKKGKEAAFSSYGYADGRNMVSLPGASYAARREKERALQSMANRSGTSSGPSASLVSTTSTSSTRESRPTSAYQGTDRSNVSGGGSSGGGGGGGSSFNLNHQQQAPRRERPGSSPTRKIDSYHERILASPLNNPSGGGSSSKSRPVSSSGSRSKKPSSASSGSSSGGHSRGLSASSSHKHFSPAAAVAEALRGYDGAAPNPSAVDQQPAAATPSYSYYADKLPVLSVEEQNAATRRALQFVYDAAEDAEEAHLAQMRERDRLKLLKVKREAEERWEPKAIKSAAAKQKEYEDSFEIAKGKQKRAAEEEEEEEAGHAYVTVNGRITRVSSAANAGASPQELPRGTRADPLPAAVAASKKKSTRVPATVDSSDEPLPVYSPVSSAGACTKASVPVSDSYRATDLAAILSQSTDYDSYVREIEKGVGSASAAPPAAQPVDPIWKSFPKFQLERIEEVRRAARASSALNSRSDAVGYKLVCRACASENGITAPVCARCTFPCVAEDVVPIFPRDLSPRTSLWQTESNMQLAQRKREQEVERIMQQQQEEREGKAGAKTAAQNPTPSAASAQPSSSSSSSTTAAAAAAAAASSPPTLFIESIPRGTSLEILRQQSTDAAAATAAPVALSREPSPPLPSHSHTPPALSPDPSLPPSRPGEPQQLQHSDPSSSVLAAHEEGEDDVAPLPPPGLNRAHSSAQNAHRAATSAPSGVSTPHPQQQVKPIPAFTFALPSSAPVLAATKEEEGEEEQEEEKTIAAPVPEYSDDFADPDAIAAATPVVGEEADAAERSVSRSNTNAGASGGLSARGDNDEQKSGSGAPLSASERFKKFKAKSGSK